MSNPKYGLTNLDKTWYSTQNINYWFSACTTNYQQRKKKKWSIHICLFLSETFHTTKVHQQRKFIAMNKFINQHTQKHGVKETGFQVGCFICTLLLPEKDLPMERVASICMHICYPI